MMMDRADRHYFTKELHHNYVSTAFGHSMQEQRRQQQAEISSVLISEQTAAALTDYSEYNVTHWQPDWYTHTDDDIGEMLHIRRTAIIQR